MKSSIIDTIGSIDDLIEKTILQNKKIFKLVYLEFDNLITNYDEKTFADYDFVKIITSGIQTFDNNKIYIDTASVSDHEIVSTDYHISHYKRPSRANMQPLTNSSWFAKLKDSPKYIKVDEYSHSELNEMIFSTGFLGLKCTNKYVNNYIYTLISSDKFQEQKNRVSVGATMQSINNDVFKSLLVPNIDTDKIESFGKLVDEYYQKIHINSRKIKELRLLKAKLLDKFF
ncbi:hypothetical protein Aocu_08830 [Acholeplasma oculi]|uniref:Type I restriction modification DNA specificity domain-containing protein n=1 Tax=Acholeplasma oculi TaxID=35623 RepID=A0A061AH62_9MOLU|nr:hypothetical protein Aocu_08830 [Acholeplasma oculi]